MCLSACRKAEDVDRGYMSVDVNVRIGAANQSLHELAFQEGWQVVSNDNVLLPGTARVQEICLIVGLYHFAFCHF